MNFVTNIMEKTTRWLAIGNPMPTFWFELKRSFTVQRSAVTAVLALFPPVMLFLLVTGTRFSARASSSLADYATFLTIFLVAMVLLLSLLLWATPNIHSELEGKSWSFIASRPDARVSLFLGKFLASMAVSFGIALFASTTCIIIQKFWLGTLDPVRLWLGMNLVFFLAAVVYSALFSAIGTIFIKRSMLVAAAYLIAFDIVIGLLPKTIINRLTIRFHLQEIGVATMGWFFPANFGPESEYRMVFGEAWPLGVHISLVVGAAILFLGIGIYVIVNREFVTKDGN